MITSKPAKGRPGTDDDLRRGLRLLQVLDADSGTPATRAALVYVAVVQKSVEHGGDGGDVAEDLAPVLDWTVRGEERARALVATHDELQQVLCSGWRQLPHAEVVDDEQRRGRELRHRLLAGAVERCLRELLDERVRVAVDDPVALLDRAATDRPCEVALAGAWRPEEEHVVVLVDEVPGGELVDDPPVHLLVEVEIEVVERPVRIPEVRVLGSAVEQSVGASA